MHTPKKRGEIMVQSHFFGKLEVRSFRNKGDDQNHRPRKRRDFGPPLPIFTFKPAPDEKLPEPEA